KDLGPSVSSGATTFTTTSTTFVRTGSYKINLAGGSGTYGGSVNVTTGTAHYRRSLDILDGSCAVVATTGFTAEQCGNQVLTFSGSLTWPAGAASICLAIEIKKVGGVGPVPLQITQDSSSFVTVAL